jgi:hypothetical protein
MVMHCAGHTMGKTLADRLAALFGDAELWVVFGLPGGEALGSPGRRTEVLRASFP